MTSLPREGEAEDEGERRGVTVEAQKRLTKLTAPPVVERARHQVDMCPRCKSPLDFVAVKGPDGCFHGRYVASCPHCDQGKPAPRRRECVVTRRCVVCNEGIDGLPRDVTTCYACRPVRRCEACGARSPRARICAPCRELQRLIDGAEKPRRVKRDPLFYQTPAEWVKSSQRKKPATAGVAT